MGLPTFRFVDVDETAASADHEFWRDVEASDRLESPLKANIYLRELCHSKAETEFRYSLPIAGRLSSEAREKALLHAVYTRGYRLFGSDLESVADRPLSHNNAGAA